MMKEEETPLFIMAEKGGLHPPPLLPPVPLGFHQLWVKLIK